jgi:dTDP-4-amino-4,6-dideoxygalactose transaminase
MESAEKFLVPKDPRLSFGALLPRFHGHALPSPVDHSATHDVFWARNAIYHGLKALGIEPGENVLVPSFHCTSVVEPILKYGAEVKFYEIGKDLRPDIADIEAKIDHKTRALLAIHYFGFPQDILALKRFCNERRLLLIEDCAHVLTGCTEEGMPLGSIGDISVFSWRKFFPLYDGGQLVINNPECHMAMPQDKNDWVFTLKVAKNILDKLLDDSESRLIRKVGQISRWPSRLARRLTCGNGYSPKAFAVNSYDLNFDLSSANVGMSSFSKYILRHTEIAEVITKRRGNFAHLAHAIRSFRGIAPVYESLAQNVCPWAFPAKVDTTGFHLLLRKAGIPAFTWGGVVHPTLALDDFPNARFLYDHLVLLPIHQSIGNQELQTMVSILQRSLRIEAILS